MQSGGAKARGRGAVSNESGRYERERREAFDDGWTPEERPTLRTTVSVERPRKIITRNQSPDLPFDRSINPYRGCEHGCSYCFARPTHAYLGLSPGLDFEARLTVKPGAAEALRRELSEPNYRCKTIALGTNTDPYQPIEKDRRITREILETLAACDHPVTIVTKGALVLRDLEILAPMAAKGLARVALSITTLDRSLARAMEPRAPTPERRLDAVRGLAEAGVPTGVMMAPIIPALTDHEIEPLLERVAEAGASWADYVTLRLPLEVAPLFKEWLAEARPQRAARVMKLVRDTQGGRDYDPEWGVRQRGTGPLAMLIARRFEAARQRLGLEPKRTDLRTDLFRPPGGAQLALQL
ncbi:MAG: PA0069 family radical SAM protein [Pseudomonadota bacterium]